MKEDRMDTSDAYPDLSGDALSYSSQRLAQLASLVTAAATVEARRRAQSNAAKIIRSERARRDLHDQERAAYQLARAGWAPAHDARWLAQAGLLQAARAWCAAAAYADADPDAAAAVHKCEERLRVLHPYAMARYDRLRSEGADPVDAMREVIPLFGRAPHARPGDPAPARRSLAAPDSADAAARDDTGTGAAAMVQAGSESAAVLQAGQRGVQIVRELQERALAERGYALSADELVTTLGATTTLPSDVIARLARADREDHVAAGAERARADDLRNAPVAPSPRGGVMHGEYLTAAAQDRLEADTAAAHAAGDRSAAQLAAESFPCTAADAVTAAVRTGPAAARVNTTLNLRRSGRSVRDGRSREGET
jgi:hypothetical protein